MVYSLAAYRSILAAALGRGTRFVPFTTALDAGPGSVVYLRHDVDFSLGMAVELARVNADLGVSGTFFILIRSPVYNALSDDTIRSVAQLAELGQLVGFHAALPGYAPLSSDGLAGLVRADFDILESHFPGIEPVFAWHNTTPALLEQGLDLEVPGLVNAYSRQLFRDIPYHSDTGMRYTVEQWLEIAAGDAPAMQLLFHPELWVGGGSGVVDALARTWPHVIREREVEFRTNRLYGAKFPDGIPAEILDHLVERIMGDDGAPERTP